MFATVAIVVVVFVIIALLARQFSRTNSMERSIRSYKRRLGTIAEVVELTAQVRTDPYHTTPLQHDANEVANEHPDVTQSGSAQSDQRLAGELGHHVYVSKEGRLVFGDTSLTPVVPPKPPIYDDHVRHRTRNRGTHAQPARTRRLSRTVLVSAVMLVVIAGVVGGVIVAKAPKSAAPKNSAAPVTPTTVAVPKAKASVSHPKSSVHGASTTLTHLLSSSATTAVFNAPSGTYTVAVYVDGVCWLGFQHNESKTGPWLAMATLGGADAKSYQLSTKGSLAITVGAPSKMTKVLVNGSLLGLPAQRANSYVITLR